MAIRILSCFLFLLITTLIKDIQSFSVDVLPGQKECFMVHASVGSPVSGSYEVIHPNADHMTITVVGPKGFMHFEKKPKKRDAMKAEGEVDKEESSEGFFSFDTELEGDYTLCFINGSPSENDGDIRLIGRNRCT